MILAWAMAGWGVGFCVPALAADPPQSNSPPAILAADLLTTPPTTASGQSPPNGHLSAPVSTSTNTLHALSSHTDALTQSRPPHTNAVAEPTDKTALSATASAASRATQKSKTPLTRKKYGGLVYSVFTTRAGYKLLNPFGPVPEEQEDNTVYDPVTGKPSGVGFFKIHWGGK